MKQENSTFFYLWAIQEIQSLSISSRSFLDKFKVAELKNSEITHSFLSICGILNRNSRSTFRKSLKKRHKDETSNSFSAQMFQLIHKKQQPTDNIDKRGKTDHSYLYLSGMQHLYTLA